MGKHGEFTIIVAPNSNIFSAFGLTFDYKNDDCKFSNYNDIIYTFYDDNDQSYSEREIYSLSNDFEDRSILFDVSGLEYTNFIHPNFINTSTNSLVFRIPKYDNKDKVYKINFTEIFKNMPTDKSIIRSMYNCVYADKLTNKCAFSIVKNNLNYKYPRFIFYYDDTILNKKDVIFIIKKIISLDYR